MSSGCSPAIALCPGSIEELRTYWQVPSIAHFIFLFKDRLKLPKIDYHDLEIAFLTPFPEPESGVSRDENLLLKFLIVLLNGYFNNHRIDEKSWEAYLKKLCRILWVDREGNPSPFLSYTYDHRGNKYEQEIGFTDLSLEAKAEVVYHLCEYRLYAEDSSDLVSHLVDDELRVEPLGKDSSGNIYWYFFGTRLYRECPSAVEKVDQMREAIIRYRAKEALDLAQKAHEELEKSRERATPDPGQQPAVKKKAKHEPIPGERTSSRISKPVDRLNGNTLRETASSASHKANSDTKKSNNSSNSSNLHQHSKNHNNKKTEIPPDPSTSCGIPLVDLKSAWDCVCDHESEWESLVASFSKSKVACEVEMYKILSKNFLPLIHEVAEKERKEKEKQQKAKILELVPRRTSSRIEIKKIQQVEEEKKEAEEREGRKRRAAQAEERRKREEERMRQEEIKRQREVRARQRLVILEDRATRASLRKNLTNESNGLHEDGLDDEDDEDVIDIADPNVTMILSNGWPPNEHSYSSPKGYLLMKAGCVDMSH